MSSVLIFMYHTINEFSRLHPLGNLSFRPQQFRRHLDYLKRGGFDCITLSELWQRAQIHQLDARKTAVLTFDDGFLDNFLVAAPILAEYGFRGTVFVNPDFTGEGEPRTLADHPTAWGNLNRSEIAALDSSDTLEIQSHTMTHNFIFVSPRLIDFYTPTKFDRYYWLAWLLFPERKPDWSEHIEDLRDAIPPGYPIFEFDRAIAHPQFIPDPAFIERAVECYAVRGEDSLADLNQLPDAEKGAQENNQAWRNRVTWELSESRRQLETIVQHPIDFLCFPGGGYDQISVDIAEQVGYRAYMVSSRIQNVDNVSVLQQSLADGHIAGLKRTSLTRTLPSFLPPDIAEYWNCKIKVEATLGAPTARFALRTAQLVLRSLGARR